MMWNSCCRDDIYSNNLELTKENMIKNNKRIFYCGYIVVGLVYIFICFLVGLMNL